jgi:GNAT superfamily N-acetyltransferase
MRDRVTVEAVGELDPVWPVLRQLFLALYEHHRPHGIGELVGDWESRWRAHLSTDSDDHLLLIARKGEKIVGFADAEIRRRPAIFDVETAYINDMYVIASDRGRGIGRELLARIEAWSASRGVTEIQLTVMATNRDSIAVYEHWGFRPQSQRMARSI